MCARRRSNFLLLRQKKVTKEKAPPSLRPLRFATGQTCVGAVAGCAVELALLLRSAARTATASQITKHARSDARAHPATAPTQAQPAGGGQPNIQTSARAVAALGPATTAPSARRLRPRSGAERSDGPSGCLLPIPSVCAEERSGQRIRARDCLSEASLSETPLDASTAGCPKRSAGTQTVGSPFLCLLSFGEAKESESPAGATTRLPPPAKA
jgi:hypothetical protein